MTRIKKRYNKMTDGNDTRPPEPPDRYVLDEITLDELGAVFTWAQITVDAQMSQESADDMQDLMESLSDRLGLEYFNTSTDIEEIQSEDGTKTFKVKIDVERTPPRPALVWTNDQPNKKGLKLIDKDYTEPEASNDDLDPEPPRRA